MIDLSSYFKDKKITTVILGATGAACFAFYAYFILVPQINVATKLNSEKEQLLVRVSTAEKEIGSRTMMNKQIELCRNKAANFEKTLPREVNTPKLLQDLSDMANANGVKILEITPNRTDSEAVSNEVYRELPILINARSGYHELGKFLCDMENAERFMKVVDINIKSGDKQKKHSVQLLVITYELLWRK